MTCGNKVNGEETGNSQDTTGRRSFWPERFGPAIVEGEIGKGGMAVVFRARHKQLGIPVAVKAMSTSSPQGDVERFKREARVGMRLSSAGCVKVYDFGEVEPFYYMIQEFVEGEDLRERIRRRRRFPWWEALALSLEITKVIEYIHSQGVIHRDIKPANIFLPWRGGIKIGDFGLATDGDETIEDERLTMAGLAIGSPAYMPPEQFRDTSSVDERGDLYSLGITFFELLTGEPPFRSKKVAALRDMHLNEARPSPGDRVHGIPKAYEDIVLKLIERDPLDRYQYSKDVVEVLSDLAKELKIEDIAEQQNSTSRRTTRTFKTIVVPDGIGLEEVADTPAEADVDILPPGYSKLHPIGEGVAWKGFLVHHVESGQELNLWLLDRNAVDMGVADRIKADLLRIGAANMRGFNGAIAVGDIEDKIYAASFRAEGKSFAEIMKEDGMIEEERAISMIQDLNVTLRPLHDAGLALRGIRPDRLYVHPTTGKTIIDAVATIICDEGLVNAESFTDASHIAYTAPERQNRALPQGMVTADLYSIGAVLFKMMTGATIHPENDPKKFLAATKAQKPMSLREILGGRCTRAVSDAVRRCLEFNAARRYQSVEAFSLALRGRRRPTPSGVYERKTPISLNSFVGLDVGSNLSRIALVNQDGLSQVLMGADGHQSIPTAIHIPDGGKANVGEAALLAARKDPKRLRRGFLKNLLQDDQGEHPIVLTALVMQNLLGRVKSTHSELPKEAVIAVPSLMEDRERYSLKLAGEIAGVRMLGTIPSTTAAALCYGLAAHSKPTRALVVDIGSTFLGVAVIEIRNGNLQVLATDGLRGFGGNSWTLRICKALSKKHLDATGIDPWKSPFNRLFLTEQVESAKKILSTRKKARVLVAAGGKVIPMTLDRAFFDEMTGDLLQRFGSVLENVLEKSNLVWNSIDRVLAVGGAARMPSVTKLIWKVTGRIPDAALDHLHSVSEGAAYYALKLKNQAGDYLSPKAGRVARKILVRNVTSFSLGVVLDTPRGQTLSHTIIPEQSPLPAKVTKIFALQTDKRHRARIRIVEGDPRVGAMRTLGICTIASVPAPERGENAVRIATTYSLSEDNELTVEACDARTGKPFKCKIDRLIAGGQGIEKKLKSRLG